VTIAIVYYLNYHVYDCSQANVQSPQINNKVANMTRDVSVQRACVAKFHQLHTSGCFVIPNPWDAGTAKFLEYAGYQALATTSAGLAFSLGRADQVGSITCEEALANLQGIVAATNLPVNADFQDGYANSPAGVAHNTARCIETGIAGLSIEDTTGIREKPLFELAEALERLRAARNAIDASGIPVLLTARCEAWLVGDSTPFQTALKRLYAYAEAGADCLFAPGLSNPDEIAQIVAAVAPKPINVLLSSPIPGLSLPKLAELGVRRVSVGSALARVAWGAFMAAAQDIAATGSFDALGSATSFDSLNRAFLSDSRVKLTEAD